MKKIPTLLVRDPQDRAHVLNEVTPGCEWVLAGEGVATRKYDGTCMMLNEHGEWWARREVKPGKAAPPGFLLVETDGVTGKTVGWQPVEQSPFVRFWQEALRETRGLELGTYELVGPKINGNPEKADTHLLIRHADAERMNDWPLNAVGAFEMIREAAGNGWEGIVWHHPDGRMAKLKARDLRPDAK